MPDTMPDYRFAIDHNHSQAILVSYDPFRSNIDSVLDTTNTFCVKIRKYEIMENQKKNVPFEAYLERMKRIIHTFAAFGEL